MRDLSKLFQKEKKTGPDTEIESREDLRREIDIEYKELIQEQLVRGGIALNCIDVEMRQAGLGRDGQPVFVGMLRLVKWERRSALRLLLGLPILEAKLRRLAQGSWLSDVSQFGGLWLHASGQLQGSTAMQELSALVLEIERDDGASNTPGAAGVDSDGPWSLPTDAGKLG